MKSFNLPALYACLRVKTGRRTLRDVAPEIGVSFSTLSRFERGVEAAPDAESLARVCEWLNCPIEFFALDATGYPEKADTTINITLALFRDKRLAPEQADILAEMMSACHATMTKGIDPHGIRR